MSVDIVGGHRRCGVLGSPIGHSLSPALHLAAYAELGLDWEYTAHDVTRDTLSAFWEELTQEWRGLSLTMPLKVDVMAHCDRVEDLGARISSINTVVFENDGTSRGYNTDVVGFVRALQLAGVERIDSVVIVGAGATAASALAAAAQLGAERATILARSRQRADQLVRLGPQLNVEVAAAGLSVPDQASGDLLVSTIPGAAQAPIADSLSRLAPVIFDVIYHPAETPLLRSAAAASAAVVPGFELLLHQAARQVELMTRVRSAPVEAMRAAGLAALEVR